MSKGHFRQDLLRLKKTTHSTSEFITEIISPGFLGILSYRIWSFFRKYKVPVFPIRLVCKKNG